MSVVIYHNPRCSKSRQTLALLEEHGAAPTVVFYLDNPPSEKELTAILQKLGARPRDIMRKNEAPYKELGLDDAEKSDADLIRAMAAHPILMERPIVVNHAKAAIGRPPETVLGIL